MRRLQREQPVLFAIHQQPVVGTYHAGVPTESQHPRARLVPQYLVIDQRDLLFQNRLQHAPIVGLLFDGVRKETVSLARN